MKQYQNCIREKSEGQMWRIIVPVYQEHGVAWFINNCFRCFIKKQFLIFLMRESHKKGELEALQLNITELTTMNTTVIRELHIQMTWRWMVFFFHMFYGLCENGLNFFNLRNDKQKLWQKNYIYSSCLCQIYY